MVALGDLSSFPAMCKLKFCFCEVVLCMSLPAGIVQHTSLASMCFCDAHPAPECALMVLQLSQALRQVGRGSVLKLANGAESERWADRALQSAEPLPPFHKFKAALELCAL